MTAPEGNEFAVGNEGGAPSGNTNAVTHGLHVENNRFYTEVMDDDERELCDVIYEGYIEEFGFRHGDPHDGQLARLFEIAVNHIKIIHSDNWMYDRPDALDPGNPMVDRETVKKPTTDGDVIDQDRYRPSAVIEAQQKLRREDRQWLKDYGLLDDPEQQKADAQSRLASAWREALEGGSDPTNSLTGSTE